MYFLQCLKRYTPMLYGIHSIISNKIPDSSSIKIDSTLKKENLLYNLLVALTKVSDFPINSLNKTPFNQTTHLLITNSILQQALLFFIN